MVKRGFIFLMLGIFVVAFAGCASTAKQRDLENQGLRNQISVLETQIQAKDQEIGNLRDSLTKTGQDLQASQTTTKTTSRKKVIGEVKSRPNVKQIQISLSNAGYDPGAIDGKIGKQTREAIKSFQRANNLNADGRVGKQTWKMLKEYLYKKVK